jgi:transcriptional regulator with XRE-family HTH domain
VSALAALVCVCEFHLLREKQNRTKPNAPRRQGHYSILFEIIFPAFPPMKLSHKLKYLMKAAGLSQPRLGEKLGCSSGTVNWWLAEKSRPNPTQAVKLAEFFGVELSWLTDDGAGTEAEVINVIARAAGIPPPPNTWPQKPLQPLLLAGQSKPTAEARLNWLTEMIGYLEARLDAQLPMGTPPIAFKPLPPAATDRAFIRENFVNKGDGINISGGTNKIVVAKNGKNKRGKKP